jgi:hypothetical protein
MKAFADTVGADLRSQGMSPSDVLRQVEKEVRKEFPNRFQNPNQNKPSGVEGGNSAQGSGGGSKDSYTLTDHERNIMNNLVRLKLMTKEEYIKQLREIS